MKRKKRWEPRKPSAGVDLVLFGCIFFLLTLARYAPGYLGVSKLLFLVFSFVMLLVWVLYHGRLTTWHD